MKKSRIILSALALALVVICAFALASCEEKEIARPSLNRLFKIVHHCHIVIFGTRCAAFQKNQFVICPSQRSIFSSYPTSLTVCQRRTVQPPSFDLTVTYSFWISETVKT